MCLDTHTKLALYKYAIIIIIIIIIIHKCAPLLPQKLKWIGWDVEKKDG